MPVERGRLKPEDSERINRNYSFLLQELDADEILPGLIDENIIDTDDKDEIESKPTRKAKVEELLKKILRSGPNESFNKFLKILEDNYDFVVERLKETNVSDCASQESYHWVSEAPESVINSKLSSSEASRTAFCLGQGWEHLFQRLEISTVMIEREKMNNGSNGVSSAITNLLIKWTQKMSKAATWKVLLDTLVQLEIDEACTIDWVKLKAIVIK